MKRVDCLLLALGLAIMFGCVATTGVEFPGEVQQEIPFQTTVFTVVTDTSSFDVHGLLAICIPLTWTVESVLSSSYGCSDPFILLGWADYGEWPRLGPADLYGYEPGPGYGWYVTMTSEEDLIYDIGEPGSAIVTITPDDSIGTYQLAFFAGVDGGGGSSVGSTGTPCSVTVVVTELKLDSETWGAIKGSWLD